MGDLERRGLGSAHVLHGSASTLARTSDGNTTYEFGVLLGTYVPLLDFN